MWYYSFHNCLHVSVLDVYNPQIISNVKIYPHERYPHLYIRIANYPIILKSGSLIKHISEPDFLFIYILK